MITPVKAWGLISVGDKVYILDGGVVPRKVLKVDLDHLKVESGILYYDEHGESWWLTERVAREKLCEKTKFLY